MILRTAAIKTQKCERNYLIASARDLNNIQELDLLIYLLNNKLTREKN